MFSNQWGVFLVLEVVPEQLEQKNFNTKLIAYLFVHFHLVAVSCGICFSVSFTFSFSISFSVSLSHSLSISISFSFPVWFTFSISVSSLYSFVISVISSVPIGIRRLNYNG